MKLELIAATLLKFSDAVEWGIPKTTSNCISMFSFDSIDYVSLYKNLAAKNWQEEICLGKYSNSYSPICPGDNCYTQMGIPTGQGITCNAYSTYACSTADCYAKQKKRCKCTFDDGTAASAMTEKRYSIEGCKGTFTPGDGIDNGVDWTNGDDECESVDQAYTLSGIDPASDDYICEYFPENVETLPKETCKCRAKTDDDVVETTAEPTTAEVTTPEATTPEAPVATTEESCNMQCIMDQCLLENAENPELCDQTFPGGPTDQECRKKSEIESYREDLECFYIENSNRCRCRKIKCTDINDPDTCDSHNKIRQRCKRGLNADRCKYIRSCFWAKKVFIVENCMDICEGAIQDFENVVDPQCQGRKRAFEYSAGENGDFELCSGKKRKRKCNNFNSEGVLL